MSIPLPFAEDEMMLDYPLPSTCREKSNKGRVASTGPGALRFASWEWHVKLALF